MKFVINMDSKKCEFSRFYIRTPCGSDAYSCTREGKDCDGNLDNRPGFCPLIRVIKIDSFEDTYREVDDRAWEFNDA